MITVGTAWADAAGNAPAGTSTSDNYAIDTVAPTVTVDIVDLSLDDASPSSAVTFTFSEAPVNFTAADVTPTNGTIIGFTATGNPLVYTAIFTADPNFSGIGTVSVGTDWQDAAGNAGVGDDDMVVIDTVRPTVSIVVGDTALNIGDDSPVTFTFSEAPTDFTNADVTIENGTLSTILATGDPLVFTATLTPAAGVTDATNMITVGTAWADAAGNAPAGASTSNNYAIDTVAPAVTVNIAADSLIDPDTSSPVTFEFSEVVTGFDAGDLMAVGGTLSGFMVTDGNSYTATFTADEGFSGTGSVTVGTDYTDVAGNTGTTGTDTVAINPVSPVILDLDGDGLEFVAMGDVSNHALFDFNGDSTKETAAWVGPDDGFLVYDANGDRTVNGGSEIAFADMTAEADTDLEALQVVFDSNGDAQLTADDAEFSRFGLWRDANSNGSTEVGEFKTLAEMGIVSLELKSNGESYSAANGQVTVHGEASFTYHDGSQGLLGDVSLALGGPADSSADSLSHGAGIDPFDLVLSRQANDLRIAVYGSTDQVTIQNWYGGTSHQVETIQAGGQALVSTQVDQLIQAMAGFTTDTGLSWDQGIVAKPLEVQEVLAASWQ
jgi:hypothetical protein